MNSFISSLHSFDRSSDFDYDMITDQEIDAFEIFPETAPELPDELRVFFAFLNIQEARNSDD